MHISTIAIVLFCLCFIVNVRSDAEYQSSCSLSINDGNCSTSRYCKCVTLTSGGNVCSQQMNCEYAAECYADDSCEKAGSVCVIDSRCPDKRLCYSTSLFDPILCPTLSENNN